TCVASAGSGYQPGGAVIEPPAETGILAPNPRCHLAAVRQSRAGLTRHDRGECQIRVTVLEFRRVVMTVVRVAAVQAKYVLMDQAATLDRVAKLSAEAAAQQAELVVFPEAFVPGNPLWIDTRPIWDDEDDWYRLLVENSVVVPGPATERLGEIARE